MTDAQIAEIIRQVTKGVADQLSATLLPKLKSIEDGQCRIRKALKIHDMKADGELAVIHPWLKLERARRYQVEDVYQFLVAHKHEDPRINTIPRACRETYKYIRSGYPHIGALMNYCYSVQITDFI